MPLLVLAVAAVAHAGWDERDVAGITVHVYTPAAEASGALLLVLHGCSQQAVTLRDRGNLGPAADAHGAVVLVPEVPDGGVYLGCWDYYGTAHDRSRGDAGALLSLLDAFPADRVYAAGLSSGAAMALTLACLAPDRIAGVAPVAAPGLGTAATEIAWTAISAATEADRCRDLAGASAASLDTQLAAFAQGNLDVVVAGGYAGVHEAAFRSLYGASDAVDVDYADVPGYWATGSGIIASDADGPRVARLTPYGLSHAWPAGTGPGVESQFVAPTGVAWAGFALDFFEEHRRRFPPSVDTGGGADDDDSAVAADSDAGAEAETATASEADTDAVGDDEEAIAPASCGCAVPTNPPGVVSVAVWAFAQVFRRRRK